MTAKAQRVIRCPDDLAEALAKGWRNLNMFPIDSRLGKKVHALATIRALRDAGYKIVKAT